MTLTYITGTRQPGKALKRFLPDYLDLLIHRGESILTTDKPGVDRLILRHCEQQQHPLEVIEFSNNQDIRRENKRRVRTQAPSVTLQKVISPSWQRFRYLADKADKVTFFHSAKTRGPAMGLSTIEAFDLACERRGVQGEQYIIQSQHAIWVNETDLHKAPILGAAHLYLYSRFVPGFDGERHSIGYYRLETWRRIGGVVQPGMGRRELVLPNVRSKEPAGLHMLHQGLKALQNERPERLVIHHDTHYLPNVCKTKKLNGNREVRQKIRALLVQYPQVEWQQESAETLRQRIGSRIKHIHAMWHHKRRVAAYRGLYQ